MASDNVSGVSDNLVFKVIPDIGLGGFWFQNLAGLVGDVANWELNAYGVQVTVANSGVDISYKGNTVDLQDFSLDVKTGTIDAKITVDGFSAGDIALFKLGADGTITLTKTTAHIIDMIAGRDIVSNHTVINLGEILSGWGPWGWPIGIVSPPIMRPMPIIEPIAILTPITTPIIIDPTPIHGGETLAVLPGLEALEADGFTIKALGSASMETFAGAAALLMPITGGFETPSGDTTEHSGSGVELSYKGSSLDLRNFVINDNAGTVRADVTLAGRNEGLETIFHIRHDGALTLSESLARLIDDAVGSNVVNAHTVIGGAYSVPLAGWGFEPGWWSGPVAVSTGFAHPG